MNFIIIFSIMTGLWDKVSNFVSEHKGPTVIVCIIASATVFIWLMLRYLDKKEEKEKSKQAAKLAETNERRRKLAEVSKSVERAVSEELVGMNAE
jgi:C4-dicarboxylate transporter